MNNELINELINLKEVELIYSNTKVSKDKTKIMYSIVCDIDSITSNLELVKKIIATMEIIKTLLSKYNIHFGYTIISSNSFENDIANKKDNIIKELSYAEVLHSKNDYYIDTIEEIKSKKHKRA